MSLRARWQRRRLKWIANRHPRTAVCKTGMRSIYILPSRSGMAMLFFLGFIFLLAVNYQNALIFGLFFWVISLAILNLHYTHHNIAGLTIRCVASRNGVDGGAVEFDIDVSRTNRRSRHAIVVSVEGGSVAQETHLDGVSSQQVTLSVPVSSRGYVVIPHITLRSVYPLGIARAWSYAHLAVYSIAYPKPVDAGIPAQIQDAIETGEAVHSVAGVSDFESLRAYVPGDRLSRVHWPASTRAGTLQVKQFVDPVAHDEWVRWDDYKMLSTEPRLQHMAFVIEQMEAACLSYGIDLPGARLQPALGAAHYHRCCEALATCQLEEPGFNG